MIPKPEKYGHLKIVKSKLMSPWLQSGSESHLGHLDLSHLNHPGIFECGLIPSALQVHFPSAVH